MMKVMCISDGWNPAPEAAHEPRPEIGDIDTVVKDFVFCEGRYYELDRFPNVYYGATMFAIISDPSADELIEETTIAEPLTA
jgi:hypothetical protein